ncbi:hypothetical protein [Flavobacterium acetivorans]|uniref:hypothetical protein n=1 Tax=Flavobacterium acetivorans TaxID=2893883 RepID=UPI001E5DA4C6|nr:hypothetical protein [Flavobacterium sp. F-29]UFH35653.1 hypothetical protein LNP19_01030 [Flavobacterium sp. F-29]
MKKLLFKISGISTLLLFISCANLPSNNINQNFTPSNDEGMIIGALSFKNEKPIFNGYSLFYTGENITDLKIKNRIYITPEQMVKMKFKPDFFDNEKAVYYFSITEKEGQYSFSSFSTFMNGGYIQKHGSVPINIPFKIEKNKVLYIGEVYVDYNKNKIILVDKKDRDIPRLKTKYPNLKIE